MEYIHVTLLHRSEDTFDSGTPRELLGQFEIYKKLNGLESKKEDKTEVKEVYIDQINF